MTFDFDQLINRKGTWSLKWDCTDRVFGRKDILPMWVADMDFPSPPQVAEAVVQRAEHGVFGYTEASDPLNDAICRWMEKRNQWTVQREWLVHSPGVVSSLSIAILAFTEVNDRILIQTPVYHPFFSCVTDNGRQLVTNSLVLAGDQYRIDFEDLDRKLGTGVKMFILCSPHNPVGRVWTREELLGIARLCEKHHVLLVSDEIHSDLVYPGYKHIPIATLSEGILQNSITCISPTKTFNIAGLAMSSVIIPNKALRSEFGKTMRRIGAGMLNIFGMSAAEAAFTHGEPWLEELLRYLKGNLEFMLEYFRTRIPAVKMFRPEATYLGWLDCRELHTPGSTLREFFIREAGVGMNDGAMFGPEGAGFQRINFACPRDLLAEGLQKIERAVNRL